MACGGLGRPKNRCHSNLAALGELSIFISWINVGEVYSMLAQKINHRPADSFLNSLPDLPIAVVVSTSLAIEEAATLVTGYPELAFISDKFKIEWIGPKRR